MKTTALLLLAALALPTASTHAQAVKLVSTPTRTTAHYAFPAQSGETVALEMLLPSDTDLATARADLVQIAGTVAAPLDIPVTIAPSPYDARLALVSFTAPTVNRITRLHLRFEGLPSWPIVVFPDPKTRTDQPDLADALKTSGLQLLVCADHNDELRNYLNTLGLRFEDLGPKAPRRLRNDELLLGSLTADDWQRLAAPDAGGHLIALVDDPAKLPGIYVQPRTEGYAAKVTLTLFPLLADNPQARETLFQLLHAALAPASH